MTCENARARTALSGDKAVSNEITVPHSVVMHVYASEVHIDLRIQIPIADLTCTITCIFAVGRSRGRNSHRKDEGKVFLHGNRPAE